MEIEDFNDDDTGPPPARGRPPSGTGRNPGLPGPGGSRGRGGFGLAADIDSGPAGLDAELERLGLQDPQPEAFGLDAETQPSLGPPASRTASGSSARGPLRGGGGLQPLGGPGAAPLGPPRAGPGPSPLRPRGPGLPPPGPSQPQPQAFGLEAETGPAGVDPGPGLLDGEASLRPGPRPLLPRQFSLNRDGDQGDGQYGLSSDLQRQPRQPSRDGAGGAGAGFGLGEDIREAEVEAARNGGLPPPGPPPLGPPPPLPVGGRREGPFPPRPGGAGYGLDGEIQAADAAAGMGPAAGGPGPLPLQPLQPLQPGLQQPQQFGLDSEVAQAGMGGSMGPGAPMDIPGMDAAGGYGRGSDIAALQQQQQRWSQLLTDTLSLDQLESMYPPEETELEVSAAQAGRIMQELEARRVPVAVVDVREVREKLIESSAPPRLAYLAAVERAAADHHLLPNCRPSLLQAKLKTGSNKLAKLVEPVMDPGDQGFVDLSYSPDGALQPESSRVWQFGLALVQATAVGKTGLQRVRQPCLFIARMALFDRRANRFLGNVLGVRPEAVSNYDKRWEFNSKDQVIVRCGCVQSDPQAGTRLVSDDALSVFVEFNVSYRLTVDDTVHMPQSEHRSSQLLDEINTCWAMISFKKCLSLQREVEITVPLYYGSIYDPQPMTAFYAQKRSKTPFLSAFKAKESPVLQFRVGPLGLGKPPLIPYAYMPTTMVATHDLATSLAAYRMNLALTLARQSGPFAAAADPVLAGFPHLLGDHHLLAEFLTRWRDLTNKMTAIIDVGCCSPDVLPPLAAMVEAFRRCTIELAPLAYCPTIPPRHINNFVEYQGHRLRLIQHYCHVLDPRTHKILGQRHPVEPLSHAGFEYLHAPFDVSEVRLCMADRLEHPQPFYRH